MLGVAFVASLGAATHAAPWLPVVLAQRDVQIATVDRQAVARWLSQFGDVVRLTRSRATTGSTVDVATIPTRGFAALWRVRHATVTIDLVDQHPPVAPLRPALCDLPPPASLTS